MLLHKCCKPCFSWVHAIAVIFKSVRARTWVVYPVALHSIPALPLCVFDKKNYMGFNAYTLCVVIALAKTYYGISHSSSHMKILLYTKRNHTMHVFKWNFITSYLYLKWNSTVRVCFTWTTYSITFTIPPQKNSDIRWQPHAHCSPGYATAQQTSHSSHADVKCPFVLTSI